jgi:hypothetical protein
VWSLTSFSIYAFVVWCLGAGTIFTDISDVLLRWAPESTMERSTYSAGGRNGLKTPNPAVVGGASRLDESCRTCHIVYIGAQTRRAVLYGYR